jgi:hypothetical protein
MISSQSQDFYERPKRFSRLALSRCGPRRLDVQEVRLRASTIVLRAIHQKSLRPEKLEKSDINKNCHKNE